VAKKAKSATVQDESPTIKMDDIVNLCKKKGFVFQSSEIYSPMAGFFDYGPLGVEMKNNIKKLWWRDIVQKREDIVGLDSSIIASPSIWQVAMPFYLMYQVNNKMLTRPRDTSRASRIRWWIARSRS
jgi:hypothetical protein